MPQANKGSGISAPHLSAAAAISGAAPLAPELLVCAEASLLVEDDLRSCCLSWSMVAEMVSCSLPPEATAAELSAPATRALVDMSLAMGLGLVTAGLSARDAAVKVLSIDVMLALLLLAAAPDGESAGCCLGACWGCWGDSAPLWLVVTALMRSADCLDSESAQRTHRWCQGQQAGKQEDGCGCMI